MFSGRSKRNIGKKRVKDSYQRLPKTYSAPFQSSIMEILGQKKVMAPPVDYFS